MFQQNGYKIITNPTPDAQILMAGQSWLSLLKVTAFHKGIQDVMATVSKPNTFLNTYDAGGSSILEAHARTDVANWYWADDPTASFPGDWTDGPLLTTCKTQLNTYIADGPTAEALCFYQVQQDAVNLDISSATNARTEASLWYYGSYYVMNELAQLIDSDDPETIPKFKDIEGRRNHTTALQTEVLKNAALDLIADFDDVYFGMDVYDLPLLTDDDHPSDHGGGTYNMGLRTGFALANQLYSGSYPQGPVVSSVTRPTTGTVDIAITVESGSTLRKPTNPMGIKIFNGSDYFGATKANITGYQWNGNTLRVSHDATGSVTVCYPYIEDGDYNYRPGDTENTCIRYSSKALTGDIGLPLRSMKAVTLSA